MPTNTPDTSREKLRRLINGMTNGINVELIMAAIDRYASTKVEEAREQIEVESEIRGKLEAIDKLIMGAGEFHDDPYEYVVPLSHIKEYRASLAKFDLSEPLFRDKAAPPKDSKAGEDEHEV